MADPKFTGAGRRQKVTREKAPPVEATDEQLAARVLATQGKPQTIAALLTPEQQAALIATLGEDGLATDRTPEAVRLVLRDLYESQKATSAEEEQPAEADEAV